MKYILLGLFLLHASIAKPIEEDALDREIILPQIEDVKVIDAFELPQIENKVVGEVIEAVDEPQAIEAIEIPEELEKEVESALFGMMNPMMMYRNPMMSYGMNPMMPFGMNPMMSPMMGSPFMSQPHDQKSSPFMGGMNPMMMDPMMMGGMGGMGGMNPMMMDPMMMGQMGGMGGMNPMMMDPMMMGQMGGMGGMNPMMDPMMMGGMGGMGGMNPMMMDPMMMGGMGGMGGMNPMMDPMMMGGMGGMGGMNPMMMDPMMMGQMGGNYNPMMMNPMMMGMTGMSPISYMGPPAGSENSDKYLAGFHEYKNEDFPTDYTLPCSDHCGCEQVCRNTFSGPCNCRCPPKCVAGLL